MWQLALSSTIFAFSFGLIKNKLVGVDPFLVAFLRMFLATLVFLPFTNFKSIPKRFFYALVLTGMMQFGLMYIFYLSSFRYLQSYEVALFTITTPIYVVIIHDTLRMTLSFKALAAAILSICAAYLLTFTTPSSKELWLGFALVQASNIAFASGQILYLHLLKKWGEHSDYQIIAACYGGAALIAFLALIVQSSHNLSFFSLTWEQWAVVFYLGVFASGISFFFWNWGARQVTVTTLAVLNNLKVPLAMIFSILFFSETLSLDRIENLILSLALFGAALFLSNLPARSSRTD